MMRRSWDKPNSFGTSSMVCGGRPVWSHHSSITRDSSARSKVPIRIVTCLSTNFRTALGAAKKSDFNCVCVSSTWWHGIAITLGYCEISCAISSLVYPKPAKQTAHVVNCRVQLLLLVTSLPHHHPCILAHPFDRMLWS